MERPPPSRLPLILAIALLLLPVLYVGSYFALVEPPANITAARHLQKMFESSEGKIANYRAFPSVATPLFWPLEQIDRRARPRAWEYWER